MAYIDWTDMDCSWKDQKNVEPEARWQGYVDRKETIVAMQTEGQWTFCNWRTNDVRIEIYTICHTCENVAYSVIQTDTIAQGGMETSRIASSILF